MHVELKEDQREWRRFAVQVCAVLLLLSWFLSWRGVINKTALPWITALLVLAGVTAVARPRWCRGFYRMGMTASAWSGEQMGWIVLTVVFFLVIVPLGWVLRLAGHDPLALKRRHGTSSYWHPARKPGPLERMF